MFLKEIFNFRGGLVISFLKRNKLRFLIFSVMLVKMNGLAVLAQGKSALFWIVVIGTAGAEMCDLVIWMEMALVSDTHNSKIKLTELTG